MRQTLFEKLMPIARFRSRVDSIAGWIGRRSVYVELDPETMKESFQKLVTAVVGLRTQKDLDGFVSELYSQAWDPELPLWRAYVINHLEDGRSLLMMKIDHAMADGMGLLDVLYHLTDYEGRAMGPMKSRVASAGCWDGCLLHMKGWWRAIFKPFVGELLPGDPPNRLKFKDAKVAGKTKAVASTKAIDLEDVFNPCGHGLGLSSLGVSLDVQLFDPRNPPCPFLGDQGYQVQA